MIAWLSLLQLRRHSPAVSGPGRDSGPRAFRAPIGRRSLTLPFCGLALLVLAFTGGCASAPQPVIEHDLDAFTAGMNGLLKTGMTLKEARALLKARMPRASINTDAPVAGGNRTKMRRVMIGWPTLDPGTTLVVTIFVDRDGRIVRWTTGPVTE